MKPEEWLDGASAPKGVAILATFDAGQVDGYLVKAEDEGWVWHHAHPRGYTHIHIAMKVLLWRPVTDKDLLHHRTNPLIDDLKPLLP